MSPTQRTAITRVMGVVLLAMCFSQPPVQAQEQTRQVTIIQDMVAVGFVPGQTFRVTVFNGDDESNRGGSSGHVQGHVKVFNGSNVLLAQTAAVDIAPEEFHSFDIDRASISHAGEPRTGRLQVRIQIVLVLSAAGRNQPSNIKARIDKVPASVELVDNLSGKTVAIPLSSIPISSIPIN